MTVIARVEHLNLTFGDRRVLTDVSFELRQGLVYGLLGRNGAGKTSLLSALTGLYSPDSGSRIELFGAPWGSAALRKVQFSRTHQTYADGVKVAQVLQMASLAHEGWDQEQAEDILKGFGVSLKMPARKLSDGQASSLGIALALASGAPLTIMDEPYSGLDPVARSHFYELVLGVAAETDRTFLISTHLIDEASPLLDRVLMLREGELVLDADAFEATTVAHEIAGWQDAVSVYLARTGLEGKVISGRSIGTISTAQVLGDLTEDREALAASLGVSIQPISLQDSVAALNFSTVDEEASL